MFNTIEPHLHLHVSFTIIFLFVSTFINLPQVTSSIRDICSTSSCSSSQVEISDPESCLPRKLLDFNQRDCPSRKKSISRRQRSQHLKWVDLNDGPRRQLLERGATFDDDGQRQIKYQYYYSSPPPPPRFSPRSYYYYPPPEENIGDQILGAILGISIPIVLISICCCYCHYRRRGRPAPAPAPAPASASTPAASDVVTFNQNTPGLDQQVIDTYPILIIERDGEMLKNMDEKTCSICLSDYELLDVLKILPQCLHRFHAPCIDEWMRSKAACPICRITLPKTL